MIAISQNNRTIITDELRDELKAIKTRNQTSLNVIDLDQMNDLDLSLYQSEAEPSLLLEIISKLNEPSIKIERKSNQANTFYLLEANMYLYIFTEYLTKILEKIPNLDDNLNELSQKYMQNIENGIEAEKDQSSPNPQEATLGTFFRNLLTVFSQQYQLVYYVFEKYRDQIQENSLNDSSTNWYPTIYNFLENNGFTPSDFEKKVYTVLQQLEHGDLLDIEGYAGTGLFLIYQNPKFPHMDAESMDQAEEEYQSWKKTYNQSWDRFYVLPTLGDKGVFLPEPGFSLVQKYGLEYFKDTEINGYQISNLRNIQIKSKKSHQFKEKHFDQPVYIETHCDFESDYELEDIIIDGVRLMGYFYEYYL